MRVFRSLAAVFCFVATGLLFNDLRANEPKMNEDELKVVQIARDYVAARWPNFDLAGSPPIIKSTGELWQVWYQLPEGSLGGTPVLLIDKKSLKVLRAHHEQ